MYFIVNAHLSQTWIFTLYMSPRINIYGTRVIASSPYDPQYWLSQREEGEAHREPKETGTKNVVLRKMWDWYAVMCHIHHPLNISSELRMRQGQASWQADIQASTPRIRSKLMTQWSLTSAQLGRGSVGIQVLFIKVWGKVVMILFAVMTRESQEHRQGI